MTSEVNNIASSLAVMAVTLTCDDGHSSPVYKGIF
jgi:hypothetical protein